MPDIIRNICLVLAGIMLVVAILFVIGGAICDVCKGEPYMEPPEAEDPDVNVQQ